MRPFDNIKTIYLLGAGGIGMSALARYFRLMGKIVTGYDRTPTSLTDELISEGIDLHFEEDLKIAAGYKPDETLVIYTPAVPPDHAELDWFRMNNFTVMKRAEVLGVLSAEKDTVAVAGTHGKTTVSTMIAHILKCSDKDCSAFLGGISKNYNTNFLYSGHSDIVVTEADEFDRSFLHLSPQIAVVTATDADHLDIYGDLRELRKSFSLFTSKIKNGGHLVYHKGIDLQINVDSSVKVHSYSASEEADFYARNISLQNGFFHFDLVLPGNRSIPGISLQAPGRINVENAVAAAAAAWLAGAGQESVKTALQSFTGVIRRLDIRIDRNDLIYIDDYAHHPEELRAAISSVKEVWPGKKITGIFQPHLYSRTRDFATEFAQSLDLLDGLLLLEIYPARESAIPGVDSGLIFNKMKLKNKILCTKDQVIDILKNKKPEVLMTLGAGDIDGLVDPIIDLFSE
ncbi:MAG: UDP-N-acetylmuramate--L-alanine ligase [Bacteroidia bacterium]|nr:UDP-N-acetylmuramate--L-alanine ligase [Bacteroidia bacterium]